MSDHGSTDESPQVIEELAKQYPCIQYVRLERGEKDDYATNFKYAFGLPETKWTWTFGDDDELMPGAIERIFEVFAKPEFDEQFKFVHVSEVTRSKDTRALVKAKMLDLCNHIGWIELTGFISGNVVRTDRLKEAVSLPSWDVYAKNAFVQSCALFEVLHDKDCAFYDIAMMKTQDEGPTEETMMRWNSFNVGLRYHYVDEALMDMRQRGIIGKVEPTFFRYLSYFLWDRFLTHILNSYNTDQHFQYTDYINDLMQRCFNLASFLEEPYRKRYEEEMREVKNVMVEHESMMTMVLQKASRMDQLSDAHSVSRFDFCYIMPQPKKNPRER